MIKAVVTPMTAPAVSTVSPITGTFALTDHDGNLVTERTYRGSWMLVFFGFTHCTMVCPRALSRLETALDGLGDLADRVRPLYITVDPARDTPAQMRAFLRESYPRFTGLTGTEEQIDAAKKAFRVFARRQDDPTDPDGYAVPHTAITYLLDPDGGYTAHFLDSHPQDDLSAHLRARITRGSIQGSTPWPTKGCVRQRGAAIDQ